MRHCLARLIRSLTFASKRPPIQAMPRRPHPRFSPIRYPTTTPQSILAHTKRVDAPLLPEQGPDLISGAVTMDHATFSTFLSLTRGTSAVSVYLPRPTGYGIVANICLVWMYIFPNEIIQCDALCCLAETTGCNFSRSTQLIPGNLVRLDGSPALTGLDMVDTIPAYDGPNLSSCFVLSS